MRWPWRRREPVEDDDYAGRVGIRDDHRTFVLCGDNMWGNSITWSTKPGDDPRGTTYAKVVGWLSTFPEPGDVIVARMGGGAGRFVVQSVEPTRTVHDMFFAEVRGVVDYLDPPPAFNSATELLGSGRTDGRAEFV